MQAKMGRRLCACREGVVVKSAAGQGSVVDVGLDKVTTNLSPFPHPLLLHGSQTHPCIWAPDLPASTCRMGVTVRAHVPKFRAVHTHRELMKLRQALHLISGGTLITRG